MSQYHVSVIRLMNRTSQSPPHCGGQKKRLDSNECTWREGGGGSLGGRGSPWCMSALGRVMGSPSPGGHCTFLFASRDGPGVRLFNPWWVSSILGETWWDYSILGAPSASAAALFPSVCVCVVWGCGGWSRVQHTTRAWIYIHQVTDPPLKVRWTQNTKSGLWFASLQFLSKKISATEYPKKIQMLFDWSTNSPSLFFSSTMCEYWRKKWFDNLKVIFLGHLV